MTDHGEELQMSIGRDELKALVKEAVRETLLEVLGDDEDSEPEFAPEIASRLRRYRDEKPVGIPIEQVIRDLDLDA